MPKNTQPSLIRALQKKNYPKVVRIIRYAPEQLSAVHPESLNTPLHLCVYDSLVDLVKLLLEAGASATARNKSGELPLHLASRPEVISLLLANASARALVNEPDARGYVWFPSDAD